MRIIAPTARVVFAPLAVLPRRRRKEFRTDFVHLGIDLSRRRRSIAFKVDASDSACRGSQGARPSGRATKDVNLPSCVVGAECGPADDCGGPASGVGAWIACSAADGEVRQGRQSRQWLDR